MKWVVGIDEVGRGPLAGPVAITSFFVRSDLYESPTFTSFVRGIKDSKVLSETQRREWFSKAFDFSKNHPAYFRYRSINASLIDKSGIVSAIREAIRSSLSECVDDEEGVELLLDGKLCAPKKFRNQKSIVRGDETIPIISLASIMAKEKRDSYMKKQSKLFPRYSFDKNVGYGTLEHRLAIKRHGLTPLHRKSFCRNLLTS